MNDKKFIEIGRKILNYICEGDKFLPAQSTPTTVPAGGNIQNLISTEAPFKGEDFDAILKDIKEKINPGLVHWTHPNFYGYFGAGSSLTSILGDLLSTGYASSPSAIELETIVLDMYAKAINLPHQFLSTHKVDGIKGGGCIQSTSFDSLFAALISARVRVIKMLKIKNKSNEKNDSAFLPQLVAYTSEFAHSSVARSCNLSLVNLRILKTDYTGKLTGDILRKAIEEDISNGLTPFFVSVGTTGDCAFDPVQEIGEICNEYPSVWLHVDAAYAGSSFILPEMYHLMGGIELADSICVNPYKFILVNPDTSILWVKDVNQLQESMAIDPFSLAHENQNEYHHFELPITQHFRALKLLFIIRTYGISGLQTYMRNHKRIADYFEYLVHQDHRFEVMYSGSLGLVCFKLVQTNGKDKDKVNAELFKNLNLTKKPYLAPTKMRGDFVIRILIPFEQAHMENIERAWKNIQTIADQTINDTL